MEELVFFAIHYYYILIVTSFSYRFMDLDGILTWNVEEVNKCLRFYDAILFAVPSVGYSIVFFYCLLLAYFNIVQADNTLFSVDI